MTPTPSDLPKRAAGSGSTADAGRAGQPEIAAQTSAAGPHDVPAMDHAGGDAGREATMFVVKLVVLTLLVGFGEAYLHDAGDLQWLQDVIAFTATKIVNLMGIDVRCAGNDISGAGYPLRVTLQCTALFAKGLFCAAVIAYPCTWSSRWVGLVVGVVGVAMVNVARIVGLVLISYGLPDLFHFAHIVLMQGFLISCVAPLWLMWAVWTGRRARRMHA